MKRIPGLDTVRALAASWVFIFHTGAFYDRSNIHNGFVIAFCGPAAVIIFFVISGFCIHYPYRNDRPRPSILSFYIRRYTRIGIPLLVVLLLAPHFQLSVDRLIEIAGWSIIVELWLYTLYPFIRIPGKKGWQWVEFLVIAFVFGYGVEVWRWGVLFGQQPTYYGGNGHLFNWAVALPCWLLGVWLAETFDKRAHSSPSLKNLWYLRVLTWVASAICGGMDAWNLMSYAWSLNIFAILTVVWLKNEIEYACAGHVLRFGEWMGKWSYSLYLMHGLALTLLQWFVKDKINIPLGIHVVLAVLLTFMLSYMLYIVVEYPSRNIARRLGNGIDIIGEYGQQKIGILFSIMRKIVH
jgi:peptidoglycan/LPS O-acetylase OafA/YrhL